MPDLIMSQEITTVAFDKDVYEEVHKFRKEFDKDGRIVLPFGRAVNYLLKLFFESDQYKKLYEVKKY